LWGGRNINHVRNLHADEVHDRYLVGAWQGDYQPAAIRRRSRSVTRSRQWYPVFHFVGGGINDGEPRFGLIGGEGHAVIR